MKRIATTAAVVAALGIALSLDAGAAAGSRSMAGGSMTKTPSGTAMASSTRTPTSTSPTTSLAAQTMTTQSAPTTRGPTTTGQPNQNCETLGNQPGNAISAPGSAFNPDGKAGSVYAGTQPQNSGNTASVSQYDVACARPAH